MEQFESIVDGSGPLAIAIKAALADASESKGKLDPDALSIRGMSGKKFRYFLNNLIETVSNPRYLEIGCWQGSTLCSALHKNALTALAIDDWSQFNGPIEAFFANVSRHCSQQTRISILTKDFRQVDYGAFGSFNIYFFDGPHKYKDQYDALALTMQALDDEFIFLVDDWNVRPVREGTMEAISDLGLTVRHHATLRTALDGTKPAVRGENSDWHNGYFFSVLAKSTP
jgi:hypothetical protein